MAQINHLWRPAHRLYSARRSRVQLARPDRRLFMAEPYAHAKARGSLTLGSADEVATGSVVPGLEAVNGRAAVVRRWRDRSDLPSRPNDDRDDQDEDDESEDHQAQVRGLELGAGPSDRRWRARVDRCPAAVAEAGRLRYRCGRRVRIVGPWMSAHTRPSRFWSGRRDSNPRPPPWQGGALPTEPRPRVPIHPRSPFGDLQPPPRAPDEQIPVAGRSIHAGRAEPTFTTAALGQIVGPYRCH